MLEETFRGEKVFQIITKNKEKLEKGNAILYQSPKSLQ